MALLRDEFSVYDYHFLLTVQAPNFCASCVHKECIVLWSNHGHKQTLPADLSTLDVSMKFQTSIKADSLHLVSRTMKLDLVE